jgi:hypothetical protein
MRAHALHRVAPFVYYLSSEKNITYVISANPINNVLWPHRAIIPSMFQSPEFTLICNPRSSRAAHVLYGGETVHFQADIKHVAGLKNGHFPHFGAENAQSNPRLQS